MLTACSSAPPPLPHNAHVGARAIGVQPPVARNDAPPKIASMWFNALDLRRGRLWTGEIVTSTNVASLEVRTNLFSIVPRRTTFGRFVFRTDVFDVPPIFIRGYDLRVIARNTAGVAAEEDLPMRIR